MSRGSIGQTEWFHRPFHTTPIHYAYVLGRGQWRMGAAGQHAERSARVSGEYATKGLVGERIPPEIKYKNKTIPKSSIRTGKSGTLHHKQPQPARRGGREHTHTHTTHTTRRRARSLTRARQYSCIAYGTSPSRASRPELQASSKTQARLSRTRDRTLCLSSVHGWGGARVVTTCSALCAFGCVRSP